MWKDITIAQPADAASVWVRRLYNEVPVLATYDATTQVFTTGTGFAIPAYIVSRWRSP